MTTASTGVASPCINICRMHEATGLCEGCTRTIDEIAAWSRLGGGAKRSVLDLLPERREVLAAHGIKNAAPPAGTKA